MRIHVFLKRTLHACTRAGQLGCCSLAVCSRSSVLLLQKITSKQGLKQASEPQQSPVHPEIRPSKPSETFTLYFVLPGRAQPLF